MLCGYSFTLEGPYDMSYDSVEDALEAAREQARNDDKYWNIDDGCIVYIGLRQNATAEISEYNTQSIIEMLQDEMNDETDGASYECERFLEDLPKDSVLKLASMLNGAMNQWAKKEKISLTVPYITGVRAYHLHT